MRYKGGKEAPKHSFFGQQCYRAKKAEAVFQAGAWKKRADTTLRYKVVHAVSLGMWAQQPELWAHVLILPLPTASQWNRAQNKTAPVREVGRLKGQQQLRKAASPSLCQSQCVCRGARMCPSAGERWVANRVAPAKPVQGHELWEYFLATLIWSRVIDGSCSFTYCWACLGHWSQDL